MAMMVCLGAGSKRVKSILVMVSAALISMNIVLLGIGRLPMTRAAVLKLSLLFVDLLMTGILGSVVLRAVVSILLRCDRLLVSRMLNSVWCGLGVRLVRSTCNAVSYVDMGTLFRLCRVMVVVWNAVWGKLTVSIALCRHLFGLTLFVDE